MNVIRLELDGPVVVVVSEGLANELMYARNHHLELSLVFDDGEVLSAPSKGQPIWKPISRRARRLMRKQVAAYDEAKP